MTGLSDYERIRQERDFYRKFLNLGDREELEPFVGEVLALIAEISQARRGYFEISDEPDGNATNSFWRVYGCTPEEAPSFRAGISQGVIAEALTQRTTIRSTSARDDTRFRERGSVRKHQIAAVLCAPILVGPFSGVIYLQDRLTPGPFTEDDRSRAEIFARHVAPLAERLMLRRRLSPDVDPTLAYRRQLRAPELIGRSEAIARVLRDAAMAARIDVGVLLTGPTGTGKTLLARVLHNNSPRAARPFVEVNCAALPEALLENEVFGALPGGHSTATHKIPGKVAAAEGGTLFLDEVSELPLGVQAKLLQLLQAKEYFPLGGSQPIRADIRVIAAANVDLKQAVARRTFREDLFYRLNVLSIRMPSLSERVEDIPDLLRAACARASDTYGLPHLQIAQSAYNAAQTAEWPGNVRQLQNAAESAVIRGCGDAARQLEARYLFPESAAPDNSPPTYQSATRQFQAQLVRRTLDEVDWNVSEAARRLDLTRTYLHKLMSSFGLVRGRNAQV
ncbi:sigma-54-dependent Fis family transcriptional regulator [Nannocystis sp. SCPEA4]|uniref:sigma-54-dependent Fis family transcriptional regulator n=1 Tax=Nannocystis sp. SCPEA4 TaxID=2996787 RepID=UPI00226D9A9F|nr:sigma-54-dependent Fis family transcriptional regulator [Nannocystis sp. SCPEA4]MCY1061754.1 sigma-54-dependent Fis family transcriptional regulator [Nannocystis sp. SCPEA4]